jgi:hypothetical protein
VVATSSPRPVSLLQDIGRVPPAADRVLLASLAAHALDWNKLFLSETGYRSFLGIGGDLQPGFTPDSYARAIVAAHVRRELKGRRPAVQEDTTGLSQRPALVVVIGGKNLW